MVAPNPHRVYHKPKGKPYAFGCNPAAIIRADNKGYRGIDLDLTANLSEVGICNHWRYPLKSDKWFDPKGRIPRNTPIDRMPYDDIKRLRYRDDGALRPMMSAFWAMELCKARGITPCFEAKGDPRGLFYKPEWWDGFRAMAHGVGVDPIIMSLPGHGRTGIRKLEAAHTVGLTTMWLWRGPYDNATYDPHIDYVKSRPGHGIYAVRRNQ